jgi:flavin reductase (DIM6/NTAB) family NADH-FMN oxidoreductase RutF
METGIREYLHIDPAETPPRRLNELMLGAIAPRPIAFASTVDKNGNPNLSPFSFFNSFGIHPPILIFSPSRRGRDATTKHTYENIKEIPEVVINVVSHSMIQQVSLASAQFPKGVNEFVKAGFTMVKSDLIRPFRVGESPVQFECKVLQVIETGIEGYAGNLMISEIIRMHINPGILTESGKIDPDKIDLVGRMGGNYYCRASGEALLEVVMPVEKVGIGFDSLPEHVRKSRILTGNDVGQLANLDVLPVRDSLTEVIQSPEVSNILTTISDETEQLDAIHRLAQRKIAERQVELALMILLLKGY